MADRFGFVLLKSAVGIQLAKTVTTDNALRLLPQAETFQEKTIINKCCEKIDRNAKAILESEDLLSLQPHHLILILSRDSFNADEIAIFNALLKYIEKNDLNTADVSDVLACLRVNLIPIADIFDKVEKSGYFSESDILNAVRAQSKHDMNLIKPRGDPGIQLIA